MTLLKKRRKINFKWNGKRLFSKRKFKKGLKNLNEDDLIIISDLDEIPNLKI